MRKIAGIRPGNNFGIHTPIGGKSPDQFPANFDCASVTEGNTPVSRRAEYHRTGTPFRFAPSRRESENEKGDCCRKTEKDLPEASFLRMSSLPPG
jgi:hypothetical protein